MYETIIIIINQKIITIIINRISFTFKNVPNDFQTLLL